jgi:hypothetical protein
MPWYDDDRIESHTQRYANTESATHDAHRAEAKGWQEQSRTTVSPHPVRWYGQVVSAEIGTFNYQRGEVEVTFTRTEQWLEQHRKA